MKELKISFPEYSREVYALPGTSLFECIARAGILIRTPCGGAGTCGKCAVKLIDGTLPATSNCQKHFSAKEISEGFRLACRCKVENDISVEIPEKTLFETGTITLGAETGKDGASRLEVPLADSCIALIEKRHLQISQPTLENPVSDLDNLKSHIGDLEISLDELKRLPLLLRDNDFSITAVISEQRIISLEAGDTTPSNGGRNYAIAIDIGTTTIAASLLDIAGGSQLGSSGMLNPQVKYGEDVLTRICAQSESDEKSKELSRCVIDGCNELIKELLEKHKILKENVYAVSIAGNTVMQMLFCGVSAKPLGEIPFAPPFSETICFPADKLGIDVHPNAKILLFPVLGGFVGGDITAGLIASGMTEREENVVLFVDVGTNGEIVLKKDGKLYATAAAAGPAFEGAGIEYGMRAGKGAIEKILIEDGDVQINVIGNIAPKGICGTALIDLVAELLKCGIIDETGRILPPDECNDTLVTHFDSPKALLDRIASIDSDSDSMDFMIVSGDDSKKQSNIYLTQKDVRSLQLASGAIHAAINILMKNAGITESDIDKMYIAGGFGNYIRRTHAKRIGMIPDIPDNNIFFIGNTSLIGAKTILFCREKLLEAERIAKEVDVVDVSLDIEFQMEFANAMIFPG
jgi:uncharacterized 2Fe-2S/4Fe-4S cluster protein (DUF4445 family)